jgi:hypothetical protein
MMETIRCSETSVLTRATRHHIPEDGILHIQFMFAVKANTVEIPEMKSAGYSFLELATVNSEL